MNSPTLSRLALLLLLPTALVAAPRQRLGFDATNVASVASAYFVPESEILFRMRNPDGSYREFQRNFDHPDALWSFDWRGRIKGERIYVTTGSNVVGGVARYVFDRGRLVLFEQGGQKHRFAYDAPRAPTAGGAPYFFGEEKSVARSSGSQGRHGARAAKTGPSRQVQREIAKKWKTSGRLRWPFPNPNANGLLYLSLAFLVSYLFFRREAGARIAGGVLFLAACAALVMTASRGSFLAFALGLLPMGALQVRTLLKSKAAWILGGLVVLTAVGWFATHESRLLTRGFAGKSKWSNELRLEMWSTAPQMIAEAPGGWGDMHVGRAYMDWYQGLDEISLPGSLVNEHLTTLVRHGRLGRFLYLFAWLTALGLLGYTAIRTKKGVAFGMAVALAVAGWFNPVYENKLLLIVPTFVGIGFLCERPWRAWRPRPVFVLLGCAAVLACCTVLGIQAVGGAAKVKRGYPIRVEDGRVYVKGENPQVWIVDDGKALGGVLACKDIRRCYQRVTGVPSVGYVRRVEDLPEKVHRLVLAGTAGDDWLQALSKGGIAAQRNIPREVVFITPPFPPSALPEGFLKSCKVRIVVGEFTARYESDYADPPPWVQIVPGMELYLSDWMRYAFAPL